MSRSYRLIKKLIKNPKAFWVDGRYNKQTKVLVKSILKQRVKNNTLLKKPFAFKYMIEELNKYGVQGIYINEIKSKQKWTLCINSDQKKEFISKFTNFIVNEDICINYNINKKPKGINNLWRDILSQKKLLINLSTSRTEQLENIPQRKKCFTFELQFWTEHNDHYLSPSPNLISRKLWKSTAKKYSLFEGDEIRNYNSILSYNHEQVIEFNIDLVFTWVNSDDADWQKLYNKHKPKKNTDATSNSRFLNRDELKYALRSWGEYGDFINNIYIVSNCEPPTWLDLAHPRIKWIYHEEIMPLSVLPTFSSHAIEASLHKIKGLGNYFIYSNDDFFLVKQSSPHDFYYSNGIAKVRFEHYGNVNGAIKEGDADYLNAARNGNKLLESTFNKSTTQLHTHSPQSMRIDVLNKMEQQYTDAFKTTVGNKFRKNDDISVGSYLYPHFAFLSGYAVQSNAKVQLIQQNRGFKKKLNRLLDLKKKEQFNRLPLSVCLNDGADSHLNKEWNEQVINFLKTFFSEKSEYEK